MRQTEHYALKLIDGSDPVGWSALNENMEILDGIFPRGGIIMWSGAADAIPAGWYLCDGTHGTPDLRDRFIVGAGGGYAVGATGGEASTTLTTAQMPSHNHPLHKEAPSYYNGPTGYRNILSGSVAFVNCYTHSWDRQYIEASQGGGQAHENRPPYYALCFIMRA